MLLDKRLALNSKNVFLGGTFLVIYFAVFCLSVFTQNTKLNEREFPLRSGNPNAFAKIEVFYDLQCASCAAYHPTLKSIEGKFGDKILATFRHFPMNLPTHDKAFLAARVVEAANVQGKGRQMLDMVLANQKKWTADPRAESMFFGYALTLRLNMQLFRKDFESEKTLHRIVDDLVLVKQLNLTATPTVFLNGKQLTFVEAIEIETKIKDLVK